MRELENAIERAVVMGTAEHILPEDLPEAILDVNSSDGISKGSGYHESIAGAKRRMILDAMKKSNGSYTEAAKILGIHPNYLHRLVKNLNLRGEIKH